LGRRGRSGVGSQGSPGRLESGHEPDFCAMK
jgi:hypothetical protein